MRVVENIDKAIVLATAYTIITLLYIATLAVLKLKHNMKTDAKAKLSIGMFLFGFVLSSATWIADLIIEADDHPYYIILEGSDFLAS